MATTNEALRDHLLAVLEAASELPREDRVYLAESFLSELDTQYRLVPRPRQSGWGDELAFGWERMLQAVRPWWPIMAVAAGLVFLLPLLLFPFFVLLHPPVLLIVLLVFLALRFRGPGMRRRRLPSRHHFM